MTSIDERIKAELEGNSEALDSFLDEQADFGELAADAFKGGLRNTMIIALACVIILASAFIWSLVEFIAATDALGKITWGVWAVLSALGAAMIELWANMQINRVSLRKEIKRFELSVQRMLDRR